MLQIRLLRVGKKHMPYFRLILVNKGKRPGNYLENLGFYSPADKKSKVQSLENERINYWISKGAQPTPTVHNILIAAKAISGEKRKIKISKGKKSSQGGSLPTGQAGAEGGKSVEKPAEEAVKKPETPATAPIAPKTAVAETPKAETKSAA